MTPGQTAADAVTRPVPPAPDGARGVPAVRRSKIHWLWAFNALLAATALGLYFGPVARLTLPASTPTLPWWLFVAIFGATEARQVFVHFRSNSHSFSLSELPLVIGLLFASTPVLLSSRLVGSLLALGVFRRQRPVKVVCNLAVHVIEAEVATCLLALIDPARDPSRPVTWAAVLGIIVVVAFVGFSLIAMVISIAEGSLTDRQLRRGYTFSVLAGMVNACLALEAAVALARNTAELVLLSLPFLGIASAIHLYASEYQKRQRIEDLYECSELLQRASVADAAMPELLAQIAQVFRAEMAEVVLLPVATGTGRASTTTLRQGQVHARDCAVDREFLEGLLLAIGADTRARSLESQSPVAGIRDWLQRMHLKDAMCTSLWGDGALLGVLIVGNRLSDVGTFDSDDVTLFETFGAQTSVAVQNMRLDNTLTYQAFHDPLTNLANRVLFTDRLEHALSRRENRGTLAVLFVDLDDFKMVNDTFGHAPGDALLRSVADRLRSVLRPSDTAARFGGDEFAILLEDAASIDDVTAVAERIVAAFKPHFIIDNREAAVHGSIGVAVAGTGTIGAEELLRHADAAMYWAKVQGKGGYEVYDAGMLEGSGRRLQVRTELERALADGDLRVHYQPIVDLATGAVHGAEALVRWEHPERGWILPSEFIGIAEETGLIDEIGDLVLREACRQMHTWDSTINLPAGFELHVNVSPRQLRSERLVGDLRDILGDTGLNPRRLVIEITESFIGDHADVAQERMSGLKELGVCLAIDDFGTGYSSLSVLQNLPFDILKVDRAFIANVDGHPRRRAFTAAIIGLGTTLGLSMVAEGVETESERRLLAALGCSLAQGFLFSRAVTAREFTGMLSEGRRLGDIPADDSPTLRVMSGAG